MRILPECSAVLDPIETTDMTTSHLTGKTTSQSTKPSKNDGKVAGYNPAQDAGQVIDETTSHLTKVASCQVIGYGYSHSTRLSKDNNQVAGYVEDADKMPAL
ncbi:MAG TPA: hypothetical protein VIM35_00825 [Gallionella sp.]